MKTKMFFSILFIGMFISLAMDYPNEKGDEIKYENLSLSEQLLLSFPDLVDSVDNVKLNKENENYFYSVTGLKDGKTINFNVITSKVNALQKNFEKNPILLKEKSERRVYCYYDGCGCVVVPTCADTAIICGIFISGQCIYI